MHETQLILYDGAERMLRQMGVDPKSVNPTEIRSDYEAMKIRTQSLERAYKSAETEANTLLQKLGNVEQYIGQNALSNNYKNKSEQSL